MLVDRIPIDFDDASCAILVNSLDYIKHVRFDNLSNKEKRYINAQCTIVINRLKSDNNQFTLNQLSHMITALRLCHHSFRDLPDTFLAFCELHPVSEARSVYMEQLHVLHDSICDILLDNGISVDPFE